MTRSNGMLLTTIRGGTPQEIRAANEAEKRRREQEEATQERSMQASLERLASWPPFSRGGSGRRRTPGPTSPAAAPANRPQPVPAARRQPAAAAAPQPAATGTLASEVYGQRNSRFWSRAGWKPTSGNTIHEYAYGIPNHTGGRLAGGGR